MVHLPYLAVMLSLSFPVAYTAVTTVMAGAKTGPGQTIATVSIEALLIAIVVSVVSPMLMAHLTNRARRKEKLEDYARQDEVAERASLAAAKLLAVNEEIAVKAASSDVKLDIIHKLTNSAMLASIQLRADALQTLLTLMKSGPGALPVSQAKIDATEKELNKVNADITLREEQAKSLPKE